MDKKTIDQILKYLSKKTPDLSPAERYMFMEKNIMEPFRKASQQYASVPYSRRVNETEFVAEAQLDKDDPDEDPTGALVD
jgi:hypothetical protein